MANVRGRVCSKCFSKLGRYDEVIICQKCEGSFHIQCVGVGVEVFQELRISKAIKQWQCPGECPTHVEKVLNDQPVKKDESEGVNLNNLPVSSVSVGVDAAHEKVLLSEAADTKTATKNDGTSNKSAITGNNVPKKCNVSNDCSKTSCIRSALECQFLTRENRLLQETIVQLKKRLENQEDIITLLKTSMKTNTVTCNNSDCELRKVSRLKSQKDDRPTFKTACAKREDERERGNGHQERRRETGRVDADAGDRYSNEREGGCAQN